MPTSHVSLLGLLLCSAIGCVVVDEPGVNEQDIVDGDESDLAEICRSPEIVTLVRPRSSRDASQGRFTYRVWFRRPETEGLPTIVHIPGGPGSTSIGHPQEWIPPTWGLVTTDPRGVGCNLTASNVDPESFYRTDELANDVVAAIADLQTKGMGKFVLHGHSYGTVLATQIAHRLAEPAQPKPEAVILEGVLGRAFTDEWMAASYVEEWAFQKATFTEPMLRALKEPKPLGFDAKVWGNFFMVVSSQLGPVATQKAFKLLEPDAAGDPIPENIEQLRSLVGTLGKIEVGAGSALILQKNVACRELTRDLPEDNVDVILDRGEIVKAPNVGTLCRGIELSRPFHVRDHLFDFRTYYFLGDHDTATPPWQGKLHFDTLTTADRVEVVVRDSGHLPLERHLAECGPTLLEAIVAGHGFGPALASCGVPIDVRSATAER